jgi:hypothetical protein
MDEATLEKSGGFGKLRDDLLSLYDVLLNGDKKALFFYADAFGKTCVKNFGKCEK